MSRQCGCGWNRSSGGDGRRDGLEVRRTLGTPRSRDASGDNIPRQLIRFFDLFHRYFHQIPADVFGFAPQAISGKNVSLETVRGTGIQEVNVLMDEIRFGLIGFGAWGAHHARAIRETPGAVLSAIAARSEASQQAARDACPDVAVVSDYRELLERADLDVIDIVVPTHQHADMACAALSSGRHVLLEKPMAGTLDDCRRILSAARTSRRLLAIGFELRLSRLWGRVEELLREDAIGTPLYCLIELFRRPYRPGSGGWRYDRDRVGNWILEEPIHFFDLARWYLSGHGEPTAVTARSNSIDDGRPLLCDNFSALLDFPNGVYAVISQTLAAFEHHQTVKLTGTRGAIWASWGAAMDRMFSPTFSLRHFDGQAVQSLDCGGPAGEVFELQQQIARMCDAVRGSQPLHADGHDGMRAVELCLAAEESARLRETVAL